MHFRARMLARMKLKQRGPADARIEYSWRVDHESGFEKTALIYDESGRLKGVDYGYPRRERDVPPPAALP
jgi:hypothetical protein